MRGMNLRLCCCAALAAFLCLVSPAGRAQQPATTAPTTTSRPDGSWRCQLPSGVFLVTLRSIVSISRHEYVVDSLACDRG